MAIDSAEKRRSIAGLPHLIPGITPNASKDQEWRQESGWGYSGILAGNTPIPPTNTRVPFVRRRRQRPRARKRTVT